MTGSKGILVFAFFCVFCCLFSVIVGDQEEEKAPGLELQFYRNSCPTVEQVVKEHVGKSMVLDPSTAAALLRLAFHDCQVDGCDGSVLLRFPNGMVTEEVSDMNFGLRKLNLIDGIKSSLETICPQTVSCADIIQLAARDGVYLSVPAQNDSCISFNYKGRWSICSMDSALFNKIGSMLIPSSLSPESATHSHKLRIYQ